MKKRSKKPKPAIVKPFADQTIKEMRLAYARINGSSVRRLRWLLNFADLNLDELSEGQLIDVRWEVALFGLNVDPNDYKSRSEIFDLLHSVIRPPYQRQVSKERDVKARDLENQNTISEARQELIEGLEKGAHPDTVRAFQSFVREGFNVLFAGEYWQPNQIPEPQKAIALPQLVKVPSGVDTAMFTPLRSDELLQRRAFDLIDAEKGRLMICENPRCKKRFVATKEGRARFHSPTCSAYVRIAKSRGKEL